MADWPQSLAFVAEIQPALALVATGDGEAVANGSRGQSNVASHIRQGQVRSCHVDGTVLLQVADVQGCGWQGGQRVGVANRCSGQIDLAANVLDQSVGGCAWVDVTSLIVVRIDRSRVRAGYSASVADCSCGADHVTADVLNARIQLRAHITPVTLGVVDRPDWAGDVGSEGVANCSRSLFDFAGHTVDVAVQARLDAA